MKVGFMFSGRGSNMAQILQVAEWTLSPIEPVVALTDMPNPPGTKMANEFGIPVHTAVYDSWAEEPGFKPSDWDDWASGMLGEFQVELVVLAGFMRILGKRFCQVWKGSCINIHPSLLPKYKGLNTHARAIKAGDSHGGVSVHYVTSELDGGPIIAQQEVPILPNDDPDTLAARVLNVEHQMYPQVVWWICAGMIHCFGNQVAFGENPTQSIRNHPLKMSELQNPYRDGVNFHVPDSW